MRRFLVLPSSLLLLPACFDPTSVDATDDAAGSTGGATSDATTDGATSMGDDDPTADSGPVDDTGATDPCDPNPCGNGGTCAANGDTAVCTCPAGFSGDLCEEADDPCADDPCDHGACFVDDDGQYCDCAPGWMGDACELDVDECAESPCLNGSTCTNEMPGFTCNCVAGWEGDLCELDIDDCTPNPCLNGGTCTDGLDSYSCACSGPFSGDDCECGPGPMATVDYTSIGTFTAPSLYDNPPGVTVTGSNTINVLNFNGLGIVGGASSNSVDGGEFIEFTFDAPVVGVTYFVPSAGNGDGNGTVGECTVQAWDEAGALIGAVTSDGAGPYALDTLFGGPQIVTRFRLTLGPDSLRVGSVTAAPIACP